MIVIKKDFTCTVFFSLEGKLATQRAKKGRSTNWRYFRDYIVTFKATVKPKKGAKPTEITEKQMSFMQALATMSI